MGFGDDEEILQDFLVEAGEILEQLSEQLVELERQPEDKDLLNAIFRGFHTVKGGAGFLQLDAMVDCCHVTENLFDMLRTGQRSMTSEMMDEVLKALDTINGQFQEISQRQAPTHADPELLAALERFVNGEDLAAEVAVDESAAAEADEAPAESGNTATKTTATENTTSDDTVGADPDSITDEEFENLLDAIDGDAAQAPAATSDQAKGEGEEITEAEFEALLDQLHGQGKGPSVPSQSKSVDKGANKTEDGASVASSDIPSSQASGDEISEAEFEALLDQLHGQGKGPSATGKAEAAGGGEPAAAQSSPSGELISDREFEDLLDQLHGTGKGPGESTDPAAANTSTPKQPASIDKQVDKQIAKKASSGSQQSAAAKADSSATPSKTPAAAAQTPAAQKGASPAAKPVPAAGVKPGATPAADGSAPGRAQPGAPGQNSIAAAETTVRVDTQRLDDIMNMVGELVLVRNRLVRLGVDSSDEALSKAVANLDVVTADLQTSVMKTRMQPIKKVFGRFPRVVRDLARNLKKEINLELLGEETDLDKNLVEALADPLVHLVRNAVDHGIELPADREKAGKPRVGKVILAAEQEGDHILLSITDDGAGMDPDALRRKAVEKGILDEDAAGRLSDSEAFNLIFAPGFSTKTEISDVSGRGVGMDVVKTKITQLNGSVDITSKVGEGSRLSIKVPLTLAIMPTLMIMLDQQTFALPLVSVNEIFQMDLTQANIVDGQECVTIRDKSIPIFHLKRWLINRGAADASLHEAHVVIVNVGTQRVGFVVDQLIGQEEVVIKPLGKMLHGTPGMAGATITGDGTIALILDVPSMLKRYANTA